MKARLIALLLLLGSFACSDGSQQPVREALEALRRIQTAVRVGVLFEHYSSLVIDAKVKTDTARRLMPDGPLKSELGAAMDCYADAAKIWGMGFRGDKLNLRREPGSALLPKYSIQVDSSGNVVQDQDEVLQSVWRSADYRIANVEKLLK